MASIFDDASRERFLDSFPLNDEELDHLLKFYQSHTPNDEPSSFSVSALFDDRFGPTQATVLRQFVQWTMENAFLMGELEGQKVALFLEAAVSLLGRRGGDAFVHRLLYQTASGSSDVTPTANQLMSMLMQVISIESQLNIQNARLNHGDLVGHGDNPIDPSSAIEAPPFNWTASLVAKAAAANSRMKGEPAPDSSSLSVEDPITWSTWNFWITECAPTLVSVVPTIFHALWFGSSSLNPDTSKSCSFRPGKPWTKSRLYIPQEWKMASCSSIFEQERFAVPLAAMLPPGHEHLFALYSSFEHGLAFPTLMQTLLGYAGPTIMIFSTTKGQVLGYYTAAPWRCNTGWHGKESASTYMDTPTVENDNDAFLFSLSPVWQMFPRTFEEHRGNGLQLLQTKSSHKTSKSLPYTGIAIGGTHPDHPRLHITESLEQCCAMATDKTFQSGPILLDVEKTVEEQECVFFDIDWIDVYAVVSSPQNRHDNIVEAVQSEFEKYQEAGQKVLEFREGQRQRMAYVDKKQFVDVLANGVLGSRLYQHRAEARGRASFCASDEESKGYYLEDKAPSQH